MIFYDYRKHIQQQMKKKCGEMKGEEKQYFLMVNRMQGVLPFSKKNQYSGYISQDRTDNEGRRVHCNIFMKVICFRLNPCTDQISTHHPFLQILCTMKGTYLSRK